MKKLLQHLNAKNLYQIFLHIAVVALAVEVLVLAKKNAELNKNTQMAVPLKNGDFFSLQNLVSLQKSYSLKSDSVYVIYIFTTTCPFCKQNLAAWNRIAITAESNDVAVFGISVDSKETTVEYLKQNHINWPVCVPQSPRDFREEHHITSVPQTILRSSDGRIERIWTGVLSKDNILDVIANLTRAHIVQNSP